MVGVGAFKAMIFLPEITSPRSNGKRLIRMIADTTIVATESAIEPVTLVTQNAMAAAMRTAALRRVSAMMCWRETV